MSLEQAVHQRWAQSQDLEALLPAERVTTGRAVDGTVPYATISRKRSRPALRTNAGVSVDEVTLRINVWHEDYDDAQAIAEQLKATFDRSDFDLAGGQRAVGMRRTADFAVQHDDGLWQFVFEFLIQVYLPQAT